MPQSQQPTAKQRRVSLSKHRKEIEGWVAAGRSDEWIADALGTTRSSVQSFRSRNRIMRRAGEATDGATDAATSQTPPADSGEQATVFEGVLDQGEEGYGLWLDPAVSDDPLFREGFAGVSDVRVVIEHGRIILEPAADHITGSEAPADDSGASDADAYRQITNGGVSSHPEQASVPTSSSGEPGRVKFFDAAKGYGFIIRSDGGEIFFHRSEIRDAKELEAGEYVLYEPGSSPRGPVAQRVRAVG